MIRRLPAQVTCIVFQRLDTAQRTNMQHANRPRALDPHILIVPAPSGTAD